MQTLILINPVVGPSRPEVPPAESALAELLSETFADLLAGTPVEQPPTGRTEPLSVPGLVAALSEGVLPVRLEAIGAVQGLAEAAMMPANGAEGGLLIPVHPMIPEVLPTPGLEAASANAAPKVHHLPADPFGWAPAPVAPSLPPTLMPQVGVQSVLGRPAHEKPTQDFSDGRLSPKAEASLLLVSDVDKDPPAIERRPAPILTVGAGSEDAGNLPDVPGIALREHPLIGRPWPDVATAETFGSEEPGDSDTGLRRVPGKGALPVAGPTKLVPVSPVTGSPTTGLLHLARDDVPVPSGDQTRFPPDLRQAPSSPVIAPIHMNLATNQTPPRAPASGAVATGWTENDMVTATQQNSMPLGPKLVTSAATGAAVLWQAGLGAKTDQDPPAEPAKVDSPASSGPRTSNPSAMLLRYEGTVVPTPRPVADFASGLPVPSRPDDPGREMVSGVLPAAWPAPTHGSVVAGIGHPTASVGLQEMPRLAAQIAGTLVSRADGQTVVALSPEELGHVRLSMQADAQNPDRMVVMLTFERPETLDLFRRHADQLADALRAAGYSGADISFGSSGGENSRNGSEPDSPASASLDASGETASTPTHLPPRIAATGSLDLRL